MATKSRSTLFEKCIPSFYALFLPFYLRVCDLASICFFIFRPIHSALNKFAVGKTTFESNEMITSDLHSLMHV